MKDAKRSALEKAKRGHKKGKLYNIKDHPRAKPMSEFMKEGRASTNAIRPER